MSVLIRSVIASQMFTQTWLSLTLIPVELEWKLEPVEPVSTGSSYQLEVYGNRNTFNWNFSS